MSACVCKLLQRWLCAPDKYTRWFHEFQSIVEIVFGQLPCGSVGVLYASFLQSHCTHHVENAVYVVVLYTHTTCSGRSGSNEWSLSFDGSDTDEDGGNAAWCG